MAALTCEIERGMVVVDYVLRRAAGGPGVQEILIGLKSRGIKAVTLPCRAPAVSALAVPRAQEDDARNYLRDWYYCEPEGEPRCVDCGYTYDECDCEGE